MNIKFFFVAIITLIFTNQKSTEIDTYGESLNVILDSKEYKSITKNRKKYHVSDEIITYSKLANFFKKELNSINPITLEEIANNGDNENLRNIELQKLNIKKCGIVQIFFSEIQDSIFFAEIFESKKAFDYSNRPDFGVSYVYMFNSNSGSVKLVSKQELIYN